MADITIIGTGNMANGLGVRAKAAGRTMQVLDRDPEKARDFAANLGTGVEGGAIGDPPTGDIVILAVPYDAATEIVTMYGDALSGRTVVDITNPIDFSTFDSLVVAPGTSAAETISERADDGADVVKAFNTTFATTLPSGEVAGEPLDVFIAGESEAAKEAVADFVTDAGMQPIDVGPLRRARELESFQLLLMRLQADSEHENFNWDTSLKILARA
ncbi:MAG: NADPH-dependent F420 reductase [Nocardiopsaceae bacterium]|nr:NADPH-dependent F420 reductase [Nocardiopsaceae bacterium]